MAGQKIGLRALASAGDAKKDDGHGLINVTG
jgi:hypothetical protein